MVLRERFAYRSRATFFFKNLTAGSFLNSSIILTQSLRTRRSSSAVRSATGLDINLGRLTPTCYRPSIQIRHKTRQRSTCATRRRGFEGSVPRTAKPSDAHRHGNRKLPSTFVIAALAFRAALVGPQCGPYLKRDFIKLRERGGFLSQPKSAIR